MRYQEFVEKNKNNEDLIEELEERAGIKQFDGEMNRQEAEKQALFRVRMRRNLLFQQQELLKEGEDYERRKRIFD